MPRKPEPPLVIELDIDTSPEARARYLEAIKILVRYIHENRQRAADEAYLKQSA